MLQGVKHKLTKSYTKKVINIRINCYKKLEKLKDWMRR
jgi:hypothetical protein